MTLRDFCRDKLNPSNWIKDLLFGGVSATALAIIFQFFKVLEKQPDLLLKWGPNFIFWILGISIAGVLASSLIDVIKAGGDRFADGQEKTVAAVQRLADSQQEMAAAARQANEIMAERAAKGDRQLDDIQTAVSYAGMQNEQIMAELKDQRKLLQLHLEKVEGKESQVERHG